VVGSWADDAELLPRGQHWPAEAVGTRVASEGVSIARLVYGSRGPARVDGWEDAPGVIAAVMRKLGVRSSVGSPVVVDGRLWGYITVSSCRSRLAPTTEARLSDFTELVATAIAGADARTEVGRLVDEQAALRRVATLVARGLPPPEVFAAVTEEVVRLLGADSAGMSRYERDGSQTVVALWPERNDHLEVGQRLPVANGLNLAGLVRERGEPARVDDWSGAPGPVAEIVRSMGVRSSSAARSSSPATCGAS
jgi:GAF domain-containing protein